MNNNFLKTERIEFHISYACDCKCVFCSEKNRLDRFPGKNPSLSEIAEALKEKKYSGFNHITFTGGEPTSSSSLPYALKIAKKLGFRTCVTTNGGAFSKISFCYEVLPLCDELILSIHGSSPDVHDRQTLRNGSFIRLLSALKNIETVASGSIYGLTNTLVLKDNINDLPDLFKFLGQLSFIKQHLISYPAPEGLALKNYKHIAPPLSMISELTDKIVSITDSNGKTLRVFGVPACMLGKNYILSNDFYWSPRVRIERSLRGGKLCLRETWTERPVRRRIYKDKCLTCRHKSFCGGFFDI
ncbi:MAG: radical SAM protein [Elusimicrobiales bacterium]|nr:radical SAM protein [Elusimicrobiales bacterium]